MIANSKKHGYIFFSIFFFFPKKVRHIGIKSLNPYLVSRRSVLINMENNDHRKGADGLKTENEDKLRDTCVKIPSAYSSIS